MNKSIVNGLLTKMEARYNGRQAYSLAVTRKSGTVDTLLVLGEESDFPEGAVKIEGWLHAQYINALDSVPVVIYPDTVTSDEDNGYSLTELIGMIKKKPKCRTTKSGISVSSILLDTDEGPIPVVVWGTNAVRAEEEFDAGDMIRVEGRLQSRTYLDREKNPHVTYELSSSILEKAVVIEEKPEQ